MEGDKWIEHLNVQTNRLDALMRRREERGGAASRKEGEGRSEEKTEYIQEC